MTEIALPFTHPPHALIVEPVVRHALEEDLGRAGDLTTDLIVPPTQSSRATLVARKSGTIAGLVAAQCAFKLVDLHLDFVSETSDGARVDAGAKLAVIAGSTRSVLTAERVALNFLGHLSGVATVTRALVDAVAGTRARIVCTRKTTPGLRALEKYAVRCGGGFNHRFGLDDAILIKDNHIAAAGGIAPAIERARAGSAHMLKIEVEVDTLEQLETALSTWRRYDPARQHDAGPACARRCAREGARGAGSLRQCDPGDGARHCRDGCRLHFLRRNYPQRAQSRRGARFLVALGLG